MSDITSYFLQQVSACKKYEGGSNEWNDKHKNRIIKTPQKKLPFVATASEISKNIVGLQNFLKEHKTAYLDTSAKYLSSSNFMTEDQKDDIDRETVSTIDKCKSGISSLQHSLMEYKKRRTVEGDLMLHLIGVVDILQQNLMDTAATFKKYKKERMKKKMQEAEGYFKLDAIKRNPLSPLRRGTSIGNITPDIKSKTATNEIKDANSINGQRKRSNSTNKENNNNTNASTSPNTSPLTGRRSRSNSANNNLNRGLSDPSFTLSPLPASPLSSSPNSSSPPSAPLSPINPATASNFLNRSASWGREQEIKKSSRNEFNSSAELVATEEEESKREWDEDEEEMLESERELLDAENASLQREFDTMVDQVRVIDQQLVAVSTLFDELTEHAVLQKETMENISDLTEGALGHTKQGVGQLQRANHRTVDFRVMVLLFLITCSVSLLFLHWYTQ